MPRMSELRQECRMVMLEAVMIGSDEYKNQI